MQVTVTMSRAWLGKIYELEITTTDGNTPEASDRRQFLYQGEAMIRFVAP